MTNKIYKSARGKQIDVGSLRLQNENVRAVGNMGVNARGDRIDSQGNVIDSKGQQLQRRIQRQTNVAEGPSHTSTRAQQAAAANTVVEQQVVHIPGAMPKAPDADPVVAAAPAQSVEPADESTGLAAAIARAKTVKQELEKTSRQQQQDKPVRKI
jgi:ribosomal protein L29